MPSAPTNLRTMFELFRFYRPEIGIERLLEDAGAARMSPRQIYHAVHNRPPDSLRVALPSAERYDAVAVFIAALSSEEFQSDLAARLLRAFPEKRRIYFVHIPKTGGVDVGTRLAGRFPSLNTNLLDPTLNCSPEAIFLALKHIVLELACSDSIFIAGHTPLGTYQSWDGDGIRYEDEVFTVVRDPVAQIVSQINYTLGRIFSREDPISADTAGWRAEFQINDPYAPRSSHETMEMARRILRHQGVVVPNVMCGFLGGGSYDRAILQTVAHDLEVTTLEQLDAWAAQRWGIDKHTRLNRSERFVSLPDFMPDDLAYAQSITELDVRYFRDVTLALQRHGGVSVKGEQIVR